MSVRVPKYRLHKARQLAVVTLDGKDHYLGKYDSPESWETYRRLVAEWLAGQGKSPSPSAQPDPRPLTILELIHAYWKHVTEYYVKDCKPTSEQDTVRQAMRFVRRLYETLPAGEFSPKALKAVRDAMIRHRITRTRKTTDPETGEVRSVVEVRAAGLSRRHINKQINRIKRMFAWAVEEELVPVAVHTALQCVKGLGKGRSAAREKPPVSPVSDRDVEAVLGLLPPAVATMVRVRRLCGCRPQEVVGMRPADIDRSQPVWEYRPARYKTEHHDDGPGVGRERVIFLGPKAQALLAPYLTVGDAEHLFSPARSERDRHARRRRDRKSPMTPSQRARKPKGRSKAPLGDCYTVASYRRAVRRACVKLKITVWSPNQLRHSSLTEIRKRFGLEAAKAAGGHREIGVTQHYAEQDQELARSVMREVG